MHETDEYERIVYILTFNRGQAPSTGKQTSRQKCLWSLIMFISDALTDVQEQHQVEIVLSASLCFMYKKEQLAAVLNQPESDYASVTCPPSVVA